MCGNVTWKGKKSGELRETTDNRRQTADDRFRLINSKAFISKR